MCDYEFVPQMIHVGAQGISAANPLPVQFVTQPGCLYLPGPGQPEPWWQNTFLPFTADDLPRNFTITCDPNPGMDPRMDVISVLTGNQGVETFTIFQDGATPLPPKLDWNQFSQYFTTFITQWMLRFWWVNPWSGINPAINNQLQLARVLQMMALNIENPDARARLQEAVQLMVKSKLKH